jgi:hypothetical protein
MIGGQPTANIRSAATLYKFTITHEYGHLQTALVPAPIAESDIDYKFPEQGVGGWHMFLSPEWQSAATVEGFAQYYSLLTWWDISTSNPGRVIAGPIVKTLAVTPSNISYPRIIDFACSGVTDDNTCPSGVANEADWMSALWNLALTGVAIDKTLRLLGEAYPWIASGESDLFWLNFFDSAAELLSQGELDDFATISAQAGINR